MYFMFEADYNQSLLHCVHLYSASRQDHSTVGISEHVQLFCAAYELALLQSKYDLIRPFFQYYMFPGDTTPLQAPPAALLEWSSENSEEIILRAAGDDDAR